MSILKRMLFFWTEEKEVKKKATPMSDFSWRRNRDFIKGFFRFS
jgi:hypothetical protein